MYTPADIQILQKHHEKTIWTRVVTIFLGLWLIVSPLSFEYVGDTVKNSDFICGALLVLFGLFSLSMKHKWAPWAVTFVGIWLQFAPLAFWAKTPFMYYNDTLVGILAIALSILIPGVPGEAIKNKGPEIPPGWSYNPSAWSQRLPIIFLAFAGWMIARVMASYQLGYTHVLWDPVFQNGTIDVITSKISKDFPVPDAGMGAMAYSIEALMGCKGGTRRWHTMPWIVVLFGILVVPLGLASIILITLQPIIVGHWCFWCLLTAVCMLIMISLTIDEVVAVLQFLRAKKREGRKLWDVLWHGAPVEGGYEDTRTPSLAHGGWKVFPSMTWGVNVPWNILATALVGGWLMVSPYVLKVTGIAADLDFIIGAMIVVVSVISMAEVVRSFRFVNMLLGLYVFISPWVIFVDHPIRQWSNLFVGILVIALSVRKGIIKEKYGELTKKIR